MTKTDESSKSKERLRLTLVNDVISTCASTAAAAENNYYIA